MNFGSLESLNCWTRCGWRPCARQMRWTELALMPTAFAIMMAVQWVASAGGSVWLSITTRSAISDSSGGMREGRVLIAQQAIVTSQHEAFLPAPHTGLRLSSLAHDLIGADAVGAQQDNLGPPDMLLWCVAIPRERGQAAAISGLESNGDSSSHAPDSHVSSPPGIPAGIQTSGLIH